MTTCTTCVSRVSPPFASPTCLYWPSDYFGQAELPAVGCGHFRHADPACGSGEGGATNAERPLQEEPSRVISSATNAEDRLTTNRVGVGAAANG